MQFASDGRGRGRGVPPQGRGMPPARGRGSSPSRRGYPPPGRSSISGQRTSGGFPFPASGRGNAFGPRGRGGSTLHGRGMYPSSGRGMRSSHGRSMYPSSGRGMRTSNAQRNQIPTPEFSTEKYVRLPPASEDDEPWLAYMKASKFSQTIADRFIEHGYNHIAMFPALTDRELIEMGLKKGNLMKWRQDYPVASVAGKNIQNSSLFAGGNVPAAARARAAGSPIHRSHHPSAVDKYRKYTTVPIHLPQQPQHPKLPPQLNFEKMTPGPYADFIPGSHVWCYNTTNDSVANGHVLRSNPFQVNAGFGSQKKPIPLSMMVYMKFSQPFLPGDILSIYHRAVKSWSSGQIMGVRPLTIAVFVNDRPVIIPQRHMHWLEFHHSDPKKEARAQAELKGEKYESDEEEESDQPVVEKAAVKPTTTTSTSGNEDDYAAFFAQQDDNKDVPPAAATITPTDEPKDEDDFAAFFTDTEDNNANTTTTEAGDANDDFGGFF